MGMFSIFNNFFICFVSFAERRIDPTQMETSNHRAPSSGREMNVPFGLKWKNYLSTDNKKERNNEKGLKIFLIFLSFFHFFKGLVSPLHQSLRTQVHIIGIIEICLKPFCFLKCLCKTTVVFPSIHVRDYFIFFLVIIFFQFLWSCDFPGKILQWGDRWRCNIKNSFKLFPTFAFVSSQKKLTGGEQNGKWNLQMRISFNVMCQLKNGNSTCFLSNPLM